MKACLVILAFVIAAAPAWAADPSPPVVLDGPDSTFRTPGGETPAVSAIESSSPSSPIGSPGFLLPGTGESPQLLDRTPVTLHYPPTIQVAQAAGTAGAAPLAGAESNPWIFGLTLDLWIPFSETTTSVNGLPPVGAAIAGLVLAVLKTTTTSHLMNVYGGSGEFQLSKGDWGGFVNAEGASLGFKNVLLPEDPLHPTQAQRSAYTYLSVAGGQYGLSYRLLGRPLDLTTWARGTQPIALDLLAGAQTFYFSTSVNSQNVQASTSATLTSPLVGARLSWDMADRWNLGLGGSIGGFGVSDTSLTWQALLTVAYRFRMASVPGAVSLAFRAQGLNFETGSNTKYLKVDAILYGPMLGFSVFF
ncbi:MAG: hypothetical protein ACHQ7N_21915 [Candidatus Methylomirabilales bacterium]